VAPVSRIRVVVEVAQHPGLEHHEPAVDPALADLRLLRELDHEIALEPEPAEARRRPDGRHRRQPP
jgi:hypothetical protein